MNNRNNRASDNYRDYENLLDDLYSLQKNLLPNKNTPSTDKTPLPPSITAEDAHNLEIPILSDIVDREINQQQQQKHAFNSAQQHLFEQPSNPKSVSDDEIDTLVGKLITRMRPKIDQLLREKIRSILVERFNREN